MFLKRLNVQLSLFFSIILIAASILLSGITFLSIFSSIKQKDQEEIRLRALQYWARFQSLGPEGLLVQFQAEELTGSSDAFIVRFADRTNSTLFMRLPQEWESFDFSPLVAPGSEYFFGFSYLESNEKRYALEIFSLILEEGYILQVGNSTETRYSLRLIYFRVFFIVLVFVVPVSFLAGILLASRSLRPIKRLNETVNRILQTGDMSSRIPSGGRNDELENLITSFNQMLERIEKLIGGMKHTLDNIAHDIRTPLTRFRGSAELALEEKDIPSLKEALSEGLIQTEHILTMLNAVLDISAAETGLISLKKENCNLEALLDELIEMYSFIAEEKQVSLKKDIPPGITLFADPGKIRQALANILDNAVKFSPQGSVVVLRVKKDAENTRITISDQGPGIPAEDIPYIWDRLYRSRSAGKVPGLGLGLSIVKAIVSAHQGGVEVESIPGKGTSFSVLLA